jgi:hypothetical protein
MTTSEVMLSKKTSDPHRARPRSARIRKDEEAPLKRFRFRLDRVERWRRQRLTELARELDTASGEPAGRRDAVPASDGPIGRSTGSRTSSSMNLSSFHLTPGR